MSDTKTVFQAVQDVMHDVKAVGKEGAHVQNNKLMYNFRGIDGVMNAVGPALREHKVIAVPMVDHAEYGTMTTGRGSQMTTCRVKMTVRWYGPAGDYFDSVTWGEAFDSGDKSTAKAHSVAFRTAILETLCLPTHEPDPDEFAYERESAQQQAEREQARQADLKSWGDNLLVFEQAGDRGKVQAGMEWAAKASDQQKFQMAQGVLNRMPGEVLDGEVVPDGPDAA